MVKYSGQLSLQQKSVSLPRTFSTDFKSSALTIPYEALNTRTGIQHIKPRSGIGINLKRHFAFAFLGGNMFRTVTIVLICVSLFVITNTASSAKIKSSWKNPAATATSLQFKKILVVAIIKQEFTRKVGEDKAVQIIKAGGKSDAVPSYEILSADDLDDKDQAKAKIEGMGFDGAILMKTAGAEDSIRYDTDETSDVWYPYYGFWDVYSAAWGAVYNATSNVETSVYIETMFYSLKDNKLIWSSITEVKDPKHAAQVVGEIAEVTTKQLQKEGLLSKK
jgi:hypothetical protein